MVSRVRLELPQPESMDVSNNPGRVGLAIIVAGKIYLEGNARAGKPELDRTCTGLVHRQEHLRRVHIFYLFLLFLPIEFLLEKFTFPHLTSPRQWRP